MGLPFPYGSSSRPDLAPILPPQTMTMAPSALSSSFILLLVGVAIAQPAPVIRCPTANTADIFINTGSQDLIPDYRCIGRGVFTFDFVKSYFLSRPVITASKCADSFKFHAYHAGGNFEYNNPVPAGKYTVNLQFAERWAPNTVGKRQLTITLDGVLQVVNGGNIFDIVTLAGGFALHSYYHGNESCSWYYQDCAWTRGRQCHDFEVTKSAAGIINIWLRGNSAQPMISGIVVTGAGASTVVGNTGVGKCT